MLWYCVAGSIGHPGYQLDHGVCGPVQPLPCSSHSRLSEISYVNCTVVLLRNWTWDIFSPLNPLHSVFYHSGSQYDYWSLFIPRKVCLLPPQPPPLCTSLQCCSPPQCPARRWAVWLYSQLQAIKHRHIYTLFLSTRSVKWLGGSFAGLYFRCHGNSIVWKVYPCSSFFCFQYAFTCF